MESNIIYSFIFSILCEILYMFGLIKNKFKELVKTYNKNHENNNNTTISYIKTCEKGIEENKLNIDKEFNFEYDFKIINHDKKNILVYNDDQDIQEIIDRDFLNYEFLVFNINYKTSKYEIHLKNDNYNFFIMKNDIGNPLFIYWYLFNNYNIELPNFNEFKENKNIWTISLIDQNADFKDKLICNSILLNKNDYIIQ